MATFKKDPPSSSEIPIDLSQASTFKLLETLQLRLRHAVEYKNDSHLRNHQVSVVDIIWARRMMDDTDTLLTNRLYLEIFSKICVHHREKIPQIIEWIYVSDLSEYPSGILLENASVYNLLNEIYKKFHEKMRCDTFFYHMACLLDSWILEYEGLRRQHPTSLIRLLRCDPKSIEQLQIFYRNDLLFLDNIKLMRLRDGDEFLLKKLKKSMEVVGTLISNLQIAPLWIVQRPEFYEMKFHYRKWEESVYREYFSKKLTD